MARFNPLTANDELSRLENLTFLWTWMRWVPRSFATHASLCNTLSSNKLSQNTVKILAVKGLIYYVDGVLNAKGSEDSKRFQSHLVRFVPLYYQKKVIHQSGVLIFREKSGFFSFQSPNQPIRFSLHFPAYSRNRQNKLGCRRFLTPDWCMWLRGS